MLDIILSKPVHKPEKKVAANIDEAGDKPLKSFVKTVSWRIIGTIDTMVISYLITGQISHALSIGSIEVFSKMILYYFHERLWAQIDKFGPKSIFKK